MNVIESFAEMLFFNYCNKTILSFIPCGRIGKVVASHAEGCWVDSQLRLHRYYARVAQLVLLIRVGGGASSQLNLRSLAPLYVAGCGRLQTSSPMGYFSRIVDTSVE